MYIRDGFTLLSALLVATLLVTIGVAVSTISLRRIQLSVSARESSEAFFSADAWTECIMYHDLKLDAFNIRNVLNLTSGFFQIGCFGEGFNVDYRYSTTTNQYQFTVDVFQNVGQSNIEHPCADARILKGGSSINTRLQNSSDIIVRGYNTCNKNDPRRVERALRTTYR
jgi:hypothetical protein